MSDQRDDPSPKSCPYYSTAQFVAIEVVLTGGGEHSPPQALQGLQATLPGKHSVTLTGGIGYKSSVPKEMAAKIKAGRMKTSEIPPKFLEPVPTSLSVQCLLAKCEKWCNKHNVQNCAPGCPECQVDLMTQAFTAALETVDSRQA